MYMIKETPLHNKGIILSQVLFSSDSIFNEAEFKCQHHSITPAAPFIFIWKNEFEATKSEKDVK